MVSTEENSSREQWHRLFSAALNGTMTEAEHDQLSALLQESREARQLWFVYTDNEIGLCEVGPLAEPPASRAPTSTGTHRSRPAICLVAIAAAVCIIAVIWISNQGTPRTNRQLADGGKTDADSPEIESRRATEAARRLSIVPDDSEARKATQESLVPEQESLRSPATALSQDRGQKFRKVSAVTAQGGMLYIIDRGSLYEVSPIDGSRRIVGDDDWQNATAIGAASGRLYVISDSQLYEVNPTTGARRSLGKANWTNAQAIVTVGEKLYIIADGVLHRVDPSDGSHEVLHDLINRSNDLRQSGQ